MSMRSAVYFSSLCLVVVLLFLVCIVLVCKVGNLTGLGTGVPRYRGAVSISVAEGDGSKGDTHSAISTFLQGSGASKPKRLPVPH